MGHDIRADGSELPRWLWLKFPLFLLGFLLLALWLLDAETYQRWFGYEIGFIELLTPALLVVAIFHGVRSLALLRNATPVSWLPGWVLLVALACIYFAGEEISWGQHFFGWQTPATLAELNDQNETNLHNISSWFDQKPRLVVEILVLTGGVILPLQCFLTGRCLRPGTRSIWFWPSRACFPAALLVILVYMPDRIAVLFTDQKSFVTFRLSEIQELFYAVFFLIYMASIHARLRRFNSCQ